MAEKKNLVLFPTTIHKGDIYAYKSPIYLYKWFLVKMIVRIMKSDLFS